MACKRFLAFVLMALWCSGVLRAGTHELEPPVTPIEQALVVARRHMAAEKIDLSDMYIANAQWHPRSGLISFWRIEWRNKTPSKGGYTFVDLYADGRVEHVLGK